MKEETKEKKPKSDIECLKAIVEKLEKHAEKNKQDKTVGRALSIKRAKLIKLRKLEK